MGKKIVWKIVSGFIIFITLFLPFYAAWYLVSVFDKFWNEFLWQPVFHRRLPLAGFLASLIIFFLIGSASETRLGIWLRQKFLERLPLVGHLLSSVNEKTREVFQVVHGFIIARFFSGWKMARIFCVFKTKNGCLGVVGYIAFPLPHLLLLTESCPIYAASRRVGGKTIYETIPNDIALKLEFSAGTTVPENAFEDLVKITFGEFVRSKGLINGLAEENLP